MTPEFIGGRIDQQVTPRQVHRWLLMAGQPEWASRPKQLRDARAGFCKTPQCAGVRRNTT